jgi:hypothetical protein
MNIEDYRKQVLAEIASTERPSAGYKDFLDRAASSERRLKSLSSTAKPATPDEADAILNVATERSEDPEVRAAALHNLVCRGSHEQQSTDVVLSVLRDKTEALAVRLAAINSLKLMLFLSPALRERQEDYLGALRVASEDVNEELRTAALELLAKRKDPETQARLLRSLKDKEKLIPTEKAVQFLGYDIHMEVYPLLRELVKERSSEAVTHEALRVLGADPNSAAFLADVYRDRSQPEPIRMAGAIALQSADPRRFEAVAKQMAMDATESEGLRASSMVGLERFSNPAVLGTDPFFRKTLDELVKTESAEPLREAASRLRSHLPKKRPPSHDFDISVP